VFLRNLLKVCPLAVKDVKKSSHKLESIATSGFGYVAMRVLSRYVVAQRPQLVEEHGVTVIGRVGTTHPLRVEAGKMLGHYHTGLQQLLPELWYDSENEQWRSAFDSNALTKALRKMKLADVDVFRDYEPTET